ncbi:hypothetical protein [Flavobacterium microcysteis]|uniref:Uncharacterized protein n=1 Tax=Flavobacterium microcysteis TaxID=2596891 RepID=A0A501QEG0_9FLAO|nr:hypothetical protein [Flavobacterium microcysteis]TPD70507.1 hypothetical protein FJA49_06105 [Flavobacterium microcysteis]
MCKQKTNDRLFLEEYCQRYFPNRQYEIIPYHFNHAGVAEIPQDDRVFYYGDLYLADPGSNDIMYFENFIPYVAKQNMFFSSLGEQTDISFIGYMVRFEVSLQGGTIK